MSATRFDTVQEYLESLPEETQHILRRIQESVRAVIPHSDEVISYGIPTYRLEGRAVLHLAGWRQHVSIYPEPPADPETTAELAPYSNGKATLRFPLDQPIPYPLIERVVELLAARGE